MAEVSGTVCPHTGTQSLTFGSLNDAIFGLWDQQRQIPPSLAEEQALLYPRGRCTRKKDGLPTWSLNIQTHPRPFSPSVSCHCEMWCLRNMKHSWDLQKGKAETGGFYFSKCWLILTTFGKKETQLFPIRSLCRLPFVEYRKQARIGDLGNNVLTGI